MHLQMPNAMRAHCGASGNSFLPLPPRSSLRSFTPAQPLQSLKRLQQRVVPSATDVAGAAVPADVEEWTPEDLLYWRTHSHPTVEAPPGGGLPVVILPGFGNNTVDYVEPFGDRDAALASVLKRRGFRVHVLQLERKDWFNVARSLLTVRYWQGKCTTHPGYSWYLERVKAAVDEARRETGAEAVQLVGHSAGGWLARAFLADELLFDAPERGAAQCNPAVRRLVSLGTPHSAPPPDRVKDMTGGTLTWVNSTWPGAHFKEAGLDYVCVAGRSVRGNQGAPRRSLSKYAHGSYTQVCGEGHRVEGDVVVPTRSALLENATAVVLNGVFHSMSRVGTYGEAARVPWYGSEEVVDTWAHHLL